MDDSLLMETILKLKSAERRLDSMTVKQVEYGERSNYKIISPCPSILSYELSVIWEMLQEQKESLYNS